MVFCAYKLKAIIEQLTAGSMSVLFTADIISVISTTINKLPIVYPQSSADSISVLSTFNASIQ